MTGTEKQLKFAEGLIRKMNEQFDVLIADCKTVSPENVTVWESCRDGYNRILSDSNAGLVIELLKINETSYKKYYKELFLNVKYGCNAMCDRILREVYGK